MGGASATSTGAGGVTDATGAGIVFGATAGDSVRIHVTKTHRRGNVWKFEGICKVDDKVVAEANFSAMVVDG